MIVWSGLEMIVWGGLSNGKTTEADRLEGASYNPATDSWRALPPIGSPGIELAAAVWTGHEMVISGTAVASAGAVGLAYNPTTNAWRQISSSPLSPREQTTSTWTGHELVVWGGLSAGVGRHNLADGAAYDPSTNRWRMLADAPIGARFSATMAWTGEFVILLGGSQYPATAPATPASGAAAYRP